MSSGLWRPLRPVHRVHHELFRARAILDVVVRGPAPTSRKVRVVLIVRVVHQDVGAVVGIELFRDARKASRLFFTRLEVGEEPAHLAGAVLGPSRRERPRVLPLPIQVRSSILGLEHVHVVWGERVQFIRRGAVRVAQRQVLRGAQLQRPLVLGDPLGVVLVELHKPWQDALVVRGSPGRQVLVALLSSHSSIAPALSS